MVQLTDKKPKRNDQPVGVHPETLWTSVKTYFAECFAVPFFGWASARSAILQVTMTSTWNITYHFVMRSIHLVERELTRPVKTVRAAITPTVWPTVGSYLKSDPMEAAASSNAAAPHSEDATPAI